MSSKFVYWQQNINCEQFFYQFILYIFDLVIINTSWATIIRWIAHSQNYLRLFLQALFRIIWCFILVQPCWFQIFFFVYIIFCLLIISLKPKDFRMYVLSIVKLGRILNMDAYFNFFINLACFASITFQWWKYSQIFCYSCLQLDLPYRVSQDL